jgi:hypothetical protein
MIVERAINDFRAQHGRGSASFVYDKYDHCFLHCLAMAQRDDVYHAEPCYLNEWSEAVAMSSFDGDYENTIRRIIFDVLGTSEPHKRVLLHNGELAVACFTSDYKMFVTIRGR